MSSASNHANSPARIPFNVLELEALGGGVDAAMRAPRLKNGEAKESLFLSMVEECVCRLGGYTTNLKETSSQCTVAESIQSANSLLLLQPSYTCGKWADLCPVWKVIRKISAGSQCSRLFDSSNQRRRCRWRWIATVVARNSTIAALGVNTGYCFWNYSHKAQVRMHSCLLLMSRMVDFSIFYLIEVILFYRRSVFWCIPGVEYSIWWPHLAFPSRTF